MNKNFLKQLFSIKGEKDHTVIQVFFFKIKTTLRLFTSLFCLFVNKFCKVKKNKIVIVNVRGFEYTCNPKYIAEEFAKRNIDKLDLVWMIGPKTDKSLIPKNFRLVRYHSLKALYELQTAKIIIANAHMINVHKKGFRKSSDTIYIQTWHGSMGIKKIDKDAPHVSEKFGWCKWEQISSACFDYFFVDSESEKQIYESAFWGHGEVLKLGKARDRIFYEDHKPIIEKVKNYYSIPMNNKICLYAPTWRPDGRCHCFNLDINALKAGLKEKFGGEWSILIRFHRISSSKKGQKIFETLYDKNEVINVTQYLDMQELFVAADVLISDYSSCLPEYCILKKKSFIYATDIESYEPGFYFPLSDLPSPIAKNNYELISNILNFNEKEYNKKCNQFLIDKGHNDDEKSCERIVDFMLDKIELKP